MGAIDYGQQEITYGYKQPATSTNFTKLIKDLTIPGIYNGFSITKTSNTNITISSGVMQITDSAGYCIRLETAETTTQPIPCTNTLTYVVAQWSYIPSVTNFVTFACVAAPAANDIVLGKLVFSGTTLQSIDYSYRTYGNLASNKIIIDSITNVLYIMPNSNFWFINADGYTISHKQITQKTTVGTLNTNSNYYLLYDGTNFSTATSSTGLAFSTVKNGWYETSGKRVLALVNSNATTITPISILLDNYRANSIDGTLAANSDQNTPSEKAMKTYIGSYADAKVEDNITNGHTTIAPSGNAVFDALALKAPLISPAFTTPNLGTPSAGTLTSCTGLPITTLGGGYAACSTAIATQAKTVALTGYVLITGGVVGITFTNGNSAASPTLNINTAGAKPLFINGAAAGVIPAGFECLLMYDGTNYNIINAVLGATAPSTQAFGDSAVSGTSLEVAHVDHKHAMMAIPTVTLLKNDATNNLTSFSTDGTLAGNTDTDIPTEKAIKTYIDFYRTITAFVAGSDFTTTSALANITGLTVALVANAVYEFEAHIKGNASTTAIPFGVNFSAASSTLGPTSIFGNVSGTITALQMEGITTLNTASSAFIAAATGYVVIKGIITTGANAGNLTAEAGRTGGTGTTTIYIGSFLKVRRIS